MIFDRLKLLATTEWKQCIEHPFTDAFFSICYDHYMLKTRYIRDGKYGNTFRS